MQTQGKREAIKEITERIRRVNTHQLRAAAAISRSAHAKLNEAWESLRKAFSMDIPPFFRGSVCECSSSYLTS
jgi:hypothetical protein